MSEVTKIAPAQELGGSLMQVLKDKDIPADKLEIVLKMQRELIAEQRVEALKSDFVAMAQEVQQVEKDGYVDLGKKGYGYTLWEDTDAMLRPILSKYGFALTFREVINGQSCKLVGELMHRDGASLLAERVLIPDTGPGRNSQQALGSAVTYAKRHLAMELCNVVSKGMDDDGRGALRVLVSDEEINDLTNLLKDNNMEVGAFMDWAAIPGVDNLADIPADHYPRLKNALEGRKKKTQGDKQ